MIKHKFKAKSVIDDGFHFSSKLEHRYYKELLLRQRSGEVIFFLRQVPFHLCNGLKMVIDYVEFLIDGDVRFVEVKGVETALYIAKKKMLEDMYPVKLVVVKKVS
jgi:hypothetical protein